MQATAFQDRDQGHPPPAGRPQSSATPQPSGGQLPPAPSAGVAPAPAADPSGRRVLSGFLYSYQEDAYGKHWVLHEGDNLVGRAETSVRCDVPVAHGTTSTRHASIRCEGDGRVLVVDLKSTNGTYVNGRRIEPHAPVPVNDGDKIRFGGYTVFLRAITLRA
jgi:hypothetical protein